jgi:two-component system chemotaxis sensor kinase CheA
VDAAAVAVRAQALGLAGTDEPLDEEHLLEALCTPGFSTRETADRASGRGVGMAVVQKTVQELGGTLRLETRVREGSRFTIRLPLTLLIIDALIVAVAGERFAVPLSAVHEMIDLQDFQPVAFENNEIVSFRGNILSLIHLAHRFGYCEPGLRRYAMVVGDGLYMAGLVIDRLLGKHEIVVRPFTDPLVEIDGFSGATELGDGRAVLILDTAELVRRSARSTERTGRAVSPVRKEDGHVLKRSEIRAGSEPYILFDLAGTAYGIPSEQVQRIEMIEEITRVPNAHPALEGVVFSRGQLVPAISLRARFGLPKIPPGIRTRLIIVHVEDRTVGLVVDTAREFVNIRSDAIQAPPETLGSLSGKYLQSIATLGERLVLLLDLASVLDLADLLESMPQDVEKGET